MENNINNYYGENIEEMGKEGHLDLNDRLTMQVSFYYLDDLFDNETRTELLKIDMLDFYMRVSS